MSRLEQLPMQKRRLGQAMYATSLETNCCYALGVQKLEEQLAAGSGNELLGMWSILEKGIEAWLFPLLYHKPELCESVEAGATKHMSAKRAFVLKCLSGVLDYQRYPVLLAFQYDRSLIAHFVGRARAAPRLQLRWALVDLPELPLHMELHRLQILDICRQLGPLSFFPHLCAGCLRHTMRSHCGGAAAAVK